jgi:two-component system nitrate/nitrite response regulator NarL
MMGRGQSTITVVVGQRALFREGVAALLRGSSFKVVATAARPSELKELRASSGSRTLVILSIDDNNGDVAETSENIKALRTRFPGSTIVVIAEMRGPTNLQQILSAAPNGYIANLSSRDVLLKLLDVALLDQQMIVLSRPTLPPSPLDQAEPNKRLNPGIIDSGSNLLHHSSIHPIAGKDPKLSQREREILVHLAGGDSNKQIARLCNITESTVKVHLKAILRKITVHNRTQAAIWAITKGYHIASKPNDQTLKSMNGDSDRSSIQRQGPSSSVKSLGLAVSGK